MRNSGAPQLLQNLAVSGFSALQLWQTIFPATSVSGARGSTRIRGC